MIQRALVGHGPTGALRRAAYVDALGEAHVDWLTADPHLGDNVAVDLEDPEAVPTVLRDRLLASEALIVAGAPTPAGQGLRVLAAWPDLLSGPVAAMSADLQALGQRTMTKSIVVAEGPGLGPAAWQAILALTALGGSLQRIGARRQSRAAGFEAIYGVGRFHDDSIAYVEAVAGAPAGAELRFYEALGRGGIREYDSRLDINRVTLRGAATPLPATEIHPYTQFVAELCRADQRAPPAELAAGLAAAHAAYRALVSACDSETAVTV